MSSIGRPLGLDFHNSSLRCCIVTATTPLPFGDSCAQTPLYRVAVDVAKLIHERLICSYVVILIALLPKRSDSAEVSNDRDLQCLNHLSDSSNLGLRNQQVDMFWHQHISVNAKAIVEAHTLKRVQKGQTDRFVGKSWSAVKTTKSNEVRVAGLMITNKSARHERKVSPLVRRILVVDSYIFGKSHICKRRANIGHQFFGSHTCWVRGIPHLPTEGRYGAPVISANKKLRPPFQAASRYIRSLL